MSRHNIYEGTRSCYALREGIYVPGSGVNLRTGISILALIERDLRRGKTYDHGCEVIPMDRDLARRRAVYLIALCRKHGAPSIECRALKRVVEYFIHHWRLPEGAERYIRITELPRRRAVPVPALATGRRSRRRVKARW